MGLQRKASLFWGLRAKKILCLGNDLLSSLALIDGIEIVREIKKPNLVIAFRLASPLRAMTYTMGNLLEKLGWHLSSIGDHTLHIALTNAHTSNPWFLPNFIKDLRFVVGLIKKYPNMKPSSSVGINGMAADFSGASFIAGEKTKRMFLSNIVKLYADNLLSVKTLKQ
jgi:hypothetical protein